METPHASWGIYLQEPNKVLMVKIWQSSLPNPGFWLGREKKKQVSEYFL